MPTMSHAVTAAEVMDREYLTLRAGILDLAAVLDRLDRAGVPPDNARRRQIGESLAILCDSAGNRAEKVQLAFSLAAEETPPR